MVVTSTRLYITATILILAGIFFMLSVLGKRRFKVLSFISGLLSAVIGILIVAFSESAGNGTLQIPAHIYDIERFCLVVAALLILMPLFFETAFGDCDLSALDLVCVAVIIGVVVADVAILQNAAQNIALNGGVGLLKTARFGG